MHLFVVKEEPESDNEIGCLESLSTSSDVIPEQPSHCTMHNDKRMLNNIMQTLPIDLKLEAIKKKINKPLPSLKTTVKRIFSHKDKRSKSTGPPCT